MGRPRKGHGREIDLTRTRRRTPQKTDNQKAIEHLQEPKSSGCVLDILGAIDEQRASGDMDKD